MATANLKRLPDDYSAVLGNVVLAAESLQGTLECVVNGLIGNVATMVIVRGQSADRLQLWGTTIAQRLLDPPWPGEFKSLSAEAKRVLDLRNQVVHGDWRVGDNAELQTVRVRRGGLRIEVMPLERLQRLLVEIRNVDVDLDTWGGNWQSERSGRPPMPRRVGDVLPDGSWRVS